MLQFHFDLLASPSVADTLRCLISSGYTAPFENEKSPEESLSSQTDESRQNKK